MNYNENKKYTYEELLRKYQILESKYKKLEEENIKLNNYLDSTFEYISILCDISENRIKRLVKDFANRIK